MCKGCFVWYLKQKEIQTFLSFLFSSFFLGIYLQIRGKKMTSQHISGWCMSEDLVENPVLIILLKKFGSSFILATNQMTLWKLGKCT